MLREFTIDDDAVKALKIIAEIVGFEVEVHQNVL